jgi:hypothetical protein
MLNVVVIDVVDAADAVNQLVSRSRNNANSQFDDFSMQVGRSTEQTLSILEEQ